MSVAESSPALWQPSHEQIKSTNLHQFIGVVSEKLSLPSANYDEFHQWSIDNPESFWAEVWDYTGIKASVDWDSILTNADQFPGATWFAGARFNFAENLLRNRSDRIAIVGR
jgi:acetoacetyl-CoA synthetase